MTTDKETGDYIACNARAVIEDNGFSEEVSSLADIYVIGQTDPNFMASIIFPLAIELKIKRKKSIEN